MKLDYFETPTLHNTSIHFFLPIVLLFKQSTEYLLYFLYCILALFVALFSKMQYYLVDFYCIEQYQPQLQLDLLIPSSQT